MGQQPITLLTFRQQPVVLAFLGDWDPLRTQRTLLDTARAELRGLGAVLLALSPRGLWCFRPDEDIQLFASPSSWNADDVAAMRANYGTAGNGQSAVFVIDSDHVIRFVHTSSTATAMTFERVVEALAMAGRALHDHGSPSTRAESSADTSPARWRPSRREVILGSLVAGCAAALGVRPALAKVAPPAPTAPDQGVDVTLRINHVHYKVHLDPRATLLDTMREKLNLTGTKKGCDHGQCGACTVLAGGRRILSCLTLAVMMDGVDVVTIEGLATAAGSLHPMQKAFVAEDGLQCGYCTPGQIMSAVGLLSEGHAQTDAEVREQMSGNLCRCGAYPNIVAAIQRARRQRGGRI
jgi:xanthine dehydrogenase YagT iron-sulfur-binding subunit